MKRPPPAIARTTTTTKRKQISSPIRGKIHQKPHIGIHGPGLHMTVPCNNFMSKRGYRLGLFGLSGGSEQLFNKRFQLVRSEMMTDSVALFRGMEQWQEWLKIG
jgi:hypothetical protein